MNHLAETGRLGTEAVVDATLVAEALKLATNRQRPDEGNGTGGFWPQGSRNFYDSFPSGQAIGSWALARVLASEYPNKPTYELDMKTKRFQVESLRGLLIGLVVATALPGAAHALPGANSSSSAHHSKQNESMRKNLPNFSEATATLYRGGQPSKRGFTILAKMGINIVVDLRGSRDSERKIVTHLGMQYVAMPWHCSFPKDKTFAQFLRLLQKNPGKKVFVHCRLGDDRTGMMIASYRMAEERWSAENAEKEMEKYGFNFTHRRLICPGLSSYEEKFPERFKTSPAFRDLR